MGELNVPCAEADALKAIDISSLSNLIDQCTREERWSPIRALRLDNCGPYVASRLRAFEQALSAHAAAKAAKKRAQTGYDVRKAGSDLEHAVRQMKDCVATEEREGQLFFVDDHVVPPFRFSEQLSVRVSYRWRENVEAEWKYGIVTFSHTFAVRQDYLVQAPARKPSAAKQERDRQEALCQQWELLGSLGLQAVRDHFRGGGSGAAIPVAVHAKTDSHTQGLNNFSARF